MIKKEDSQKAIKKERYTQAIGRRKTSVARVRLFKSSGEELELTLNDKKLVEYFPIKKHQNIAMSPFETLAINGYRITTHVEGGGVSSQAESVRLGISRALVSINPAWRSRLKALGYLTRDPRMVERKKPGLRKARRPQQWRKR